ncbi:thioredoxin [Candidatus Dojkabacteria bacterium]|nr:thioredoxin [Candidatus Dojkabacteria bacterium]
MTVVQFNDANFETDVEKSQGLVLVDFWATWCGPCLMMTPIIEGLSTDYAEKVTIGKLNVDENRTSAAKFNIMSIPALILFKDGKVVETIVGARPKAEIKKIVDQHL